MLLTWLSGSYVRVRIVKGSLGDSGLNVMRIGDGVDLSSRRFQPLRMFQEKKEIELNFYERRLAEMPESGAGRSRSLQHVTD